MEPILGVLVVVALLAAATGAAATTPAGRRVVEKVTTDWGRAAGSQPRSARPGRASGWGSGLATVVRAGVDRIRNRRGGVSSSTTTATKPDVPTSPIGAGDDASTPVDPTPPGMTGGTYTPPSGPQDGPDAPGVGTFTGPEYVTRPTGPAPDFTPAAGITADYEPVDGQVVPNTLHLTSGATSAPDTAASATLVAADTQEDPMSTDVATVGAAITYEMTLASAAACLQNGAALDNIASQTAGGIEHVIACLQGVGFRDDEVYSAFYVALEAMRGAHRAAERAKAAATMAHNALVVRHGTAAAALAGNTAAATNTGYYTGGV